MDTLTEFSRDEAEEAGFDPSVIGLLGISTLPGIGVATIRQIGDTANVAKLLSLADVEDFAAFVNVMGAKFSPSAAKVTNWQELRERIWRSGKACVLHLLDKGVRCVTPSSPFYPSKLNDLGVNKPHLLFLQGNASLLAERCIAVVGTRQPTEAGVFLTKYAVSACREVDAPVISGLAKGIDSVAHEWALELNLPTISILGSGILVPYPSKNIELAHRIVKSGGLLISEYLPDQSPSADSFVWRNRLQACLSEAVVATEWKRSSGTAHTIRFANGLDRLSISTHLLGKGIPPDAGSGRAQFILPAEHSRFIATLSSAITGKSNNYELKKQIEDPDLIQLDTPFNDEQADGSQGSLF